jgi:glycosyltransferase involved in cell wall biosynthesis
MKKHIFIIWTRRINLQRGGVHRIIHILMTYLPKYGYEVDYLYTTDGYLTVHHYLSPQEDMPIAWSDLPAYLSAAGCDLLIGQDGGYSAQLSLLVKEWHAQGIEYITQFHNSVLLMEKTFSRSYWKWAVGHGDSLRERMAALTRWCFYPLWLKKCRKSVAENILANQAVARKIVVLSRHELPEIARLTGRSTDKFAVINNPLSWEKIESPEILRDKKKEVLIVSRLYNPEKRIDLALKAWHMIEQRGYADWRLRIVGAGKHEAYLKSYAKRLKLKNVSFEGRRESYPYYQTAAIFMMTSAVEGWGLTLTESMQTATVPVAFDSYPAIRDIITDGHDGVLVANNDVAAYADAVARLIDNPQERNRIALNGLQSCRRFVVEPIVEQWVKLIESL